MEGLTVAEVCYLAGTLPLDARSRQALERVRVRLAEQMTPDEIDALRDFCGERLQEVGFDEQYNPTREGQLLEALVDKLYVR